MNKLESPIGLIPQDWTISCIGDCFYVNQGKQLSASKREGNNQAHFLRTANVFWDRLDLTSLDSMHFSDEERRRLALQKDDILVCEGGDIGRTALWNGEIDNCFYQNHLHRLRAREDIVDPAFFVFWMQYAFCIGKVYFGIGNKTTIPNLAQSKLKALPIPVLPKSEQLNIVTVLSKIKSSIDIQEKIIKTTTELKKALMQKLFTQGLNGEEQKETKIGLIPKSWRIESLADISEDFLGGGTPSTKEKNYWDGEIPWTTSKRLTDDIYLSDGEKGITKLGLENSSTNLVPKNNLIVSTRVSVGKVAINTIDMAINQDLTGILIDKSKYDLEFLAYQIKTNRIQAVFKSQKRGVTITGITREDLKKLDLTLPELDVQEDISKVFITLDKKIGIATSKKRILESLFKSMLHNLMTGQVRVKDLSL